MKVGGRIFNDVESVGKWIGNQASKNMDSFHGAVGKAGDAVVNVSNSLPYLGAAAAAGLIGYAMISKSGSGGGVKRSAAALQACRTCPKAALQGCHLGKKMRFA